MLVYSSIQRALRSGPRHRDAAVSLGTSRFTANLFRRVNHATLIFTQLCSPAQGARCGRFNFRPQLVCGIALKPPQFCRRSHSCLDLELSRSYFCNFRNFYGQTRLFIAKYKDFLKFRQLAIARFFLVLFNVLNVFFYHLTIFLALYFSKRRNSCIKSKK